MAYYAKINNESIVENVILADQEVIDSEVLGDPSNFIETKKDGSIRKQYAGIGDTYDQENDVFISPQPYSDWVLNSDYDWEPPIQKPDDGKNYSWNQENSTWDEVEQSG